MDLDSSLDDLIKKRKTFGSDKNKFKKQNNNANKTKKQHQNQPQSRPSLQTNKAKVTKPTQRNNSGINARLVSSLIPIKIITRILIICLQSTAGGNAPSSGPLFTAKNTPTQQRQTPKADPSQIIITKAIPASNSVQSRIGNGITGNDKKVKSVIASRLGAQTRQQQPQPHHSQQQKHHQQQQQQQQRHIAPPLTTQTQKDPIQIRGIFQSGYAEQGQGISIRGRSNTATARPGLSIRGESGPTTVLMTGLDAYCNSDDVRVSLI